MLITKNVQDTQVDPRKFVTLKQGVTKFMEQKERRMMMEELTDYLKTLFEDFQLIDMIVKFFKEPKTAVAANENEPEYKTYVS